MSTETAQDTTFFQQGQDALRKATDAWNRTFTVAAPQVPGFSTEDAEAAVDRFFDLNEKLLGAQRDFAKSVVVSLSEAGAAAAAKVGQAANA